MWTGKNVVVVFVVGQIVLLTFKFFILRIDFITVSCKVQQYSFASFGVMHLTSYLTSCI